ncbi:MAG TPA: VWA domain-containing protein [Thermoanaerobaculia bacterium]|nr:VWA domain-containing protein [Thermoanaerobaculia bacterium]
MRPRTTIGVLASIFALLVAASPADARQRRADFEDVTTVTLVEVPVQVTLKGEPVRGLTKDSFEIVDGKKKQDISFFEVVDLGQVSGPGSAADVPVAGRRHFLVFFDLTLSDINSVGRAREAAMDVVMKSLHPTDLVGVATYAPTKGPQLILSFTTDRDQVRYAIETLGFVEQRAEQRDPLGLVSGGIEDIGADRGSDSQAGSSGGAGIDVQNEIQTQVQALANLRGRAQREEQISYIARLMDAVSQMGQVMAAIEGRKHILFLSEGFNGELLFGTEDLDTIADINRAVEEGRTQDVDNDIRFGDSGARRVVDRTLEVLRAADCMVQAVDIGGLLAGAKNSNLEALQYMARETGGEMFANYNQLGDAMDAVLDRTSVTYLLAFSPTDLESDGSYRELKVRLKDGPRGADVIHRPGYFAPKPLEQQNPFEQRLALAQEVIGGQAGGAVGTGALATAFLVPGEKAYVPVLVEVDGEDLTRGLSDSVVPMEIFAYAIDNDGTVRDFFASRLGVDKEAAGPALTSTGVKYWGHFDLDPGEYTVRVLVRNGATGSTGLDVSSVTVPEDGDQLALLPPLVPEQPGKWVILREQESEQRPGVGYPFMAAGNPFIPAARPELSGNGKSQVNLLAYNLGGGSVSVTAELIDDSGQTIEGGSIELAGEPSSEAGLFSVPAVFEGSSVAPGDYTLVVTLKDLSSNTDQTSSIPVRVVG